MAQNRTLIDSMNQIASQSQVTPEMAPKIKRMPADLAYENMRKVFTLGHVGENEAFEQLSNTALHAIGSPTVSEKTKMNFYNLFQERIGYHNRNNALDPRYPYFVTNFYSRISMTDKAYEYAKKAYDLSPQKQSFAYTLAVTEVQRGDRESAVAHIKKSYEDAPQNREAFGYYTSILFDDAKMPNGKYDVAKLEKII